MRRLLPLLALFACGDPKPPAPCGSLAQLTVNVGERGIAEPCFEDPDGDAFTLTVATQNPDVATAGLIGERVQVQGVSPGVATVVITATDTEGLTGSQDLSVLVPNRAPTGTLDDISIPAGDEVTIDLSGHFSDPDGQELTYTATSSAPAVVQAALSGTMLTLTAGDRAGAAEISVTASDGEQETTVTFTATVKQAVEVLADDFNSDATFDNWTLSDSADAEITGGHFVLEAVNEGFWALAEQELGGEATDWVLEIALKTDDEDTGVGFWIETGSMLGRPISSSWARPFSRGSAT